MYLIIPMIVLQSIYLFIRGIIHLLVGLFTDINPNCRIGFIISSLCPFMKYHLLSNKKTELANIGFRFIVISDAFASLLLLTSGILGLVIYIGNYIIFCTTTYPVFCFVPI
jgi:hypothetical protein